MHQLISSNQSFYFSKCVCSDTPCLGVLEKDTQRVIPDGNSASVTNSRGASTCGKHETPCVQSSCACRGQGVLSLYVRKPFMGTIQNRTNVSYDRQCGRVARRSNQNVGCFRVLLYVLGRGGCPSECASRAEGIQDVQRGTLVLVRMVNPQGS